MRVTVGTILGLLASGRSAREILADYPYSRRVQFLATKGIDALHWSAVGDARATDATTMRLALDRGYAVFTHDLDVSAILATAGASGPSVLRGRAQDVSPEAIGEDVVRILVEHAPAIDAGAIVTIDELGARVRVLPIRGRAPRP